MKRTLRDIHLVAVDSEEKERPIKKRLMIFFVIFGASLAILFIILLGGKISSLLEKIPIFEVVGTTFITIIVILGILFFLSLAFLWMILPFLIIGTNKRLDKIINNLIAFMSVYRRETKNNLTGGQDEKNDLFGYLSLLSLLGLRR